MTDAPLIPDTPTAEEYRDAAGRPLDDIFARTDPLALFADWLADAVESEINDPNAVAVASVDASGLPDVRMVLLKDYGPRGFVFYSHTDGAKGRQILGEHPGGGAAAMCFHWKSLHRQVRLRGPVELVGDAEADAYFASRARLSRIGAIASRQSRELESREVLRARVAELDARLGEDVPRPAEWTGYRIVPVEIEFWRDRAFRLHDRLVFRRDGQGRDAGWTTTRLYP